MSAGRPAGNVCYGTSSWTDTTLLESSEFYPPDAKKPEERLRFYAEHFPLVEVDCDVPTRCRRSGTPGCGSSARPTTSSST